MRSPPVRSYIHIVVPRSRASWRGQQAVAGEHRQQERQHAHEVRRGLAQDLALGERFVDEPDFLLLQVADAAVHELRRLRRRARREVALVDERDAQAARRGVERDAGAGDAAADDEHVEVLVGEAAQRVGAVEVHGAFRLPGDRRSNGHRSRPRNTHREGVLVRRRHLDEARATGRARSHRVRSGSTSSSMRVKPRRACRVHRCDREPAAEPTGAERLAHPQPVHLAHAVAERRDADATGRPRRRRSRPRTHRRCAGTDPRSRPSRGCAGGSPRGRILARPGLLDRGRHDVLAHERGAELDVARGVDELAQVVAAPGGLASGALR